MSCFIQNFQIQILEMAPQILVLLIFELFVQVFVRELKELLVVQGSELAVGGFVERELVVVD
jgi:hypothetical protein